MVFVFHSEQNGCPGSLGRLVDTIYPLSVEGRRKTSIVHRQANAVGMG